MKYKTLKGRVKEGDDALWGAVLSSKGAKFVKITRVDHGRVFCEFKGQEYGDYKCNFQKIEFVEE